MAQTATPADLIKGAIARHPGCSLDDLLVACPTLTWNQIFLEVDRLSRAGRLRLMLSGRNRYMLAIATEAESCVSQPPDAPGHPAVPMRSRHDATCERCSGTMVSEVDDDFNGWWCILCGKRIDPVILAQRRESQSADLRTMHAGS